MKMVPSETAATKMMPFVEKLHQIKLVKLTISIVNILPSENMQHFQYRRLSWKMVKYPTQTKI